MKKIYYMMGKSSSGKDSISRVISEKYHLNEIVLYTTRPMRSGEAEGVQYHFTTIPRFWELEKQGDVIEYRCYHTIQGDWYYYTVFDEQFTDESTGDGLIIGTLESYVATKAFLERRKRTGNDASCLLVPVYIEVESGERLARALTRERGEKNPDFKELCRRFLADEEDFSEEKLLEAGIERRFVNDELGRCLAEIGEMIENG